MLRPLNIGDFDVRFDIISPTNDDTGPNRLVTWTAGIASPTYPNVWAKEVKASGSEGSQEDQVIATSKRAWVIRLHDRTVTTGMAVYLNSELWYITAVHPYGGDRLSIVLECEAMDND